MTSRNVPLLRSFLTRSGVVLAALTLCAAARQSVEPAGPPLPQHPELPGIDDPRQEMIDLFQKVELRLKEIDSLLYDAGAGDRALDGSLDSGMSKLLEETRSKSDEVLSGIDRILEIAKQQGGSASAAMTSSPGDPSSPGGGQPQQGSQRPQQREATPDRPGGSNPPKPNEQPGGEKPENSQQPDPKSGDPLSPKDQRGAAQNQPGGPPPKLDTQRVDPNRDGERWGDLPEQYRELFRTEGGGDMPSQYRDWIDAYYRRLNQRR